MKLHQYITLLITLCLVSCQKYVDIKKSGSQSFLETANDCQLILDNYDLFNTNYPIDGEISADDYRLNEERFDSDQISIEDRNLYSWKADAIRAAGQQWVSSYNKIYHTNLVLETVGDLEGKEAASVLNPIKGAALFLRAYALWNLAQLYAKPYNTATAPQDAGLPVHLMSDINDTPGRGTVKDTYDSIVKDLIEAADLMNPTSTVASRPNRVAAHAMLARVYLSMGDYPNALISANAALELKSTLIDFNTLDKQSFAPFRRFNAEVIFHSTVFHQNGTLEPGYGYEDLAIITPEIIAEYANNDLRKIILVKENLDVPVPSGTYRFIGNYEGAVGSAKLFNGLAVDELYLIRAECNARTGNAATAMEALNTLLRTRWLNGTYVNITIADANDALSLILKERRKELLMRGLRWTDLRRLNRDPQFAKVLSRKGGTATYTLPPNDIRYTLLIPQEVITNSTLIQNGR
ncbi:RagB/SusD family nutrient uptake outer membrane protein [Pedobacter psychroterrae]|uniref:RagB/SusD family nutrient uptake outer membrane protein n=1 Tax=Pedobacter psychroterrae TaxID=2530453 RepID=A0A4R0NRY8_9SPHI|nr:RagB/SusD family nutrient uptake outer membrane protein [Pedobacter psychroterrae]TCD03940.1 RagB/SusD family nutrient uptake outer membrane protein [Pedobacter psychroterrae]